jgi:hypothetical protein
LAPDVREANQRDENQSQELDRFYDLIHFKGFLLQIKVSKTTTISRARSEITYFSGGISHFCYVATLKHIETPFAKIRFASRLPEKSNIV